MSALAAAAGSTEGNPVTLATEVALAMAAIVSAVTPIALQRRRARRDALAKAAATAVSSSDVTLAGWTALNSALQQEINRLQGVQERLQSRADLLESELAALQKLAIGRGAPGA